MVRTDFRKEKGCMDFKETDGGMVGGLYIKKVEILGRNK